MDMPVTLGPIGPPAKANAAGPARVQRPSAGSARTAIVMRTSAQSRSSSSVISTSHTHVVRPRWRRRATAWIVPSRIGRRKLVWFESPWALWPSGATATQVASEVIDSAIEAKTPPCTSPAGWRSSSRTTTCAVTSSSESARTSRP